MPLGGCEKDKKVVEQICPHCGSEDKEHLLSNWCPTYENWLILGRFEFLVPVLENPDWFLESPPPSDPGLVARERGKKSCVILMAAWITELALKTLLVTEGHSIDKKDVWGHNLRSLYDALTYDTKQELRDIHRQLGAPYNSWRAEDSVEDILGSEANTFVVWRYLWGQNEIKTEPKKLITVARAAFFLHLKRTELPAWPAV
ncbi:MAG: hypothetical protein F4W95_14415 [Chloroflexi bacterium]|nr:hypothetical protein [Chloroflexota bacterium]MYD49655.1 hypothetical protein [Chloroflexota bacterium]